MNRSLAASLLAAALLVSAGCASRPPKPPECEGPLTPINANASTPRAAAGAPTANAAGVR